MGEFVSVLQSSSIVFLASIVQGSVGFGFALIAVPLLTFILPMKVIVPMVVVYSLITNIMVMITARRHIRLSQIWIMIFCGIAGIPMGILGLKHLSPEGLKVMLGLLICITAISMAKGYRVKFKRMKMAYGVTGFISGVLNGGLSMSGPPIVLFLSNEGYDKHAFRANLTAYATITNSITIVMFIWHGFLTVDMVSMMGSNIVALLAGSVVGIIVARKMEEKYFRKIVLMLLIALGAITIIKAILNS